MKKVGMKLASSIYEETSRKESVVLFLNYHASTPS